MANQSYTYVMKAGKNFFGLVSSVEKYLNGVEKMETQRVKGENSDYVAIQARVRGGAWKQVVGLDKAITIRFIKESSDKIRMEIGEAKWVDKGGIMLLSMFVLWPLAITSGIGTYKQGRLPGKIKEAADAYTETVSLESAQKAQKQLEREEKWIKSKIK